MSVIVDFTYKKVDNILENLAVQWNEQNEQRERKKTYVKLIGYALHTFNELRMN